MRKTHCGFLLVAEHGLWGNEGFSNMAPGLVAEASLLHIGTFVEWSQCVTYYFIRFSWTAACWKRKLRRRLVRRCVHSAYTEHTGVSTPGPVPLLTCHGPPFETHTIFHRVTLYSSSSASNLLSAFISLGNHAPNLVLVIISLSIQGRRITFCLIRTNSIWIYLGWVDIWFSQPWFIHYS